MPSLQRKVKRASSATLAALLRRLGRVRTGLARLYAHARLSAEIPRGLPASAVVLGRISVFGTARITVGEDLLIYPDVHFETQGEGEIVLGDGVVISRGAHVVAMARLEIGAGTMIGEYASVRDANHRREPGRSLRDSGYLVRPIRIGRQVWIGRGAIVLPGVTLGDRVTVGANAVVTRRAEDGLTVVGVPARPLAR
jgi:acetyltransferase-like isoleucine patch superfamily enzyme